MPGPISKSYHGPGANTPYVPSWCFGPEGAPQCVCGHHEGYHDSGGRCNQSHECGCIGFSSTVTGES